MSLHSSATEVVSINDNGGEGGFDFHPVVLQRAQGAGAYAVDTHFWDRLNTPSYRIALLSRRHTDVLVSDVHNWPQGLYADPRHVSGRAAWYSFAFLLRSAAAALLDVDLQEVQAGIRTLQVDGMPRGQAFLSDTLENGAGYCRWLADESNFGRLLEMACDLVSGQIGAKWLLPDHANRCDTSCNHCLRDFYNMQYHGLLDWRLAVDMARVGKDSSAMVDLSSPWSPTVPNPWWPLIDGERSPVTRTLGQFGYVPTSGGTLPWYVSRARKRVLVPCHPLWTAENPIFREAAQEAATSHSGYEMARMDLFMAMRRPGDFI